jgi:hypothetical protein
VAESVSPPAPPPTCPNVTANRCRRAGLAWTTSAPRPHQGRLHRCVVLSIGVSSFPHEPVGDCVSDSETHVPLEHCEPEGTLVSQTRFWRQVPRVLRHAQRQKCRAPLVWLPRLSCGRVIHRRGLAVANNQRSGRLVWPYYGCRQTGPATDNGSLSTGSSGKATNQQVSGQLAQAFSLIAYRIPMIVTASSTLSQTRRFPMT